ncbi:MAG: hypothetical protein Q8J64_03705 [Thermodesulfovibrionales bacterium]|nr:hypothetical protein [Thermodesulfovibrionales bacterium]
MLGLLTALLISQEAFSGDIKGLGEENRLLKAELQLAHKQDIYFVFDMSMMKIDLKARGATLKQWAVQDTKLWGYRPDIKPHALLKKSTLLKPRRAKIKPGSSAEVTEDPEALELKDMPSSYSLHISDGVLISVRPEGGGPLSALMGFGRKVRLQISRPLLSLWNAVSGRPFSAIDLVMKEKEAQALYWSFSEGSGCIIYYTTTDD